MSYDVIVTPYFERRLKKLAKKYKSLKKDLLKLIESLEAEPNLGISLGMDCYKVRMAITSKGKGKSGGARVITHFRVVNNAVFLVDIFDKSDQENIPDHQLKALVGIIEESFSSPEGEEGNCD